MTGQVLRTLRRDWEDLDPNGLCKNRKSIAKCSICIKNDMTSPCNTVEILMTRLPDEVRKKLGKLGN